MNRDQIDSIQEIIAEAIQINVNGKIDRLAHALEQHIIQHQSDFKRIEPVLAAYETEKEFNKGVSDLGEKVVWWSKVVAAVGVLAVAVKYAVFNWKI